MQPWLLCWGSGKDNDTFQGIMELVFQPPLTSCPLLPQPQAQGYCGSPVSHLTNSSQEQFSGEAVAPPREQRGCFSVYTWGSGYDPSLIYTLILFLCKTGTSEVDQQDKIYSDFCFYNNLFILQLGLRAVGAGILPYQEREICKRSHRYFPLCPMNRWWSKQKTNPVLGDSY